MTNTNDQANAISIRGNSPNHMIWQLEGVEIVNPNHTNNAGTFSDRSTQSAGGVNILSAQLLNTSNFLTDAFPSQYGNALSGVMDMRLRRGNNERMNLPHKQDWSVLMWQRKDLFQKTAMLLF